MWEREQRGSEEKIDIDLDGTAAVETVGIM